MKVEFRNGLQTEVYQILVIEHDDTDYSQVTNLFERTSISIPTSRADIRPRIFRPHREKSIAGAIAQLEDPETVFDAILLDHRIPDNAGQGQVVGDLVYYAGKAPVLLLTGYGDDPEDIRKCLRQGVTEHLSIPLLVREGPQRLATAVLDAIAEREGVQATEKIRLTALAVEVAKLGWSRRALMTLGAAIIICVGSPSLLSKDIDVRIPMEARIFSLTAVFTLIWKKKPGDAFDELKSRARRRSRNQD